MSDAKQFTHVFNFTGYMRVVADWFERSGKKLKILDMPAGAGQVSDALRGQGHEVVSADINKEKSDYLFVDMSKPLPFQDEEFDAVVCLEGIEHVINQTMLLRELVRIVKREGTVVISTPNIGNFFSRFQFLFTGIFFQFEPAKTVSGHPDELIDRGHISPISYPQLRYYLDCFGADVIDIRGDRYKRKLFFPIYLALIPFGWLWSKLFFRPLRGGRCSETGQKTLREVFSAPLLFSRTMVLFAKKR